MTQKIFNGFPQYYAFTTQSGKFYGTPSTQINESHTDINLQSQLIGDSISISIEEIAFLSIYRDGAYLYESQGFDIIAPNIVRVSPGLLDTETVEFKKLIAASGVVEMIPSVPPVAGSEGYVHTINEATVYTDNSIAAVNALPAVTLTGKTRITAEFDLDEGRVDVYINGYRSSINDGSWIFADANTIEFQDDYSAVKMKVDIIKQKVG